MQHAQALEAVRRVVRAAFAELSGQSEVELTEHLLLRDDFYCGRRFLAAGLQASWFIEEDEIKIHAQDGSVTQVMKASEVLTAPADTRRAA